MAMWDKSGGEQRRKPLQETVTRETKEHQTTVDKKYEVSQVFLPSNLFCCSKVTLK